MMRPVSPHDTLFILGEEDRKLFASWTEIYDGSHFLFDKELELTNTLNQVLAELSYVIKRFQEEEEKILVSGLFQLTNYLGELNNTTHPTNSDFLVQLYVSSLQTYFKAFLYLSKSALDKLVPFYSYAFFDSQKKFSNKGTDLIGAINRNKNIKSQEKKKKFINLIKTAKADWLNLLVSLRDDATHFTALPEYRSFWIEKECLGQKNEIDGITSFHRPAIFTTERQCLALEFLIDTKSHLLDFIKSFIKCCEFSSNRRPKRYLKCECGHEFARKGRDGAIIVTQDIELQVKKREIDYGVLICPKCRQKTDTDIRMWKNARALK